MKLFYAVHQTNKHQWQITSGKWKPAEMKKSWTETVKF